MNRKGKIILFILRNGVLRFIGAVILSFLLVTPAHSQVQGHNPGKKGTGQSSELLPGSALIRDTLPGIPDSLLSPDTRMASDSIPSDSLGLAERLGIRLSPDAMESVVESRARDSAVLDLENDHFYLYGEGEVVYQNLNLKAGRIVFVQSENLVTAMPLRDSLGAPLDRPSFSQGPETFYFDSMKYHFQSKRALVRNARTQYGEGFVHSEQVKRNPDQSIYGLGNIYTTCDLDTPHFGIRAGKIKVIPNKVIASGSAHIMIEQVPTPVVLPFGLFPISETQRSGFKLPTYTIEEVRGLGLINGGYYFHLGEKADLLMQTQFFTKGSWGISGLGNYVNRYRYSGGLSFSYAYNKLGDEFELNGRVQKDFQVEWQHRSDPKSRPGVGFNASVIFGSSSFNQNNSYDVQNILQNQYNSNITYSKQWQNAPVSLTISARHSQNTQTGEIEVNLPEMNLFVTQFNPFQGKNSLGTRWYEKITASYQMNAMNRLRFQDSSFRLEGISTEDMVNGMKHSIPVNATYNILRFVNLNFGINYNEYWLTRKQFRFYDPVLSRVDTVRESGFFTARDFNAHAGLNTRIYGIKMFKTGKLMGIRHVLNPSASFVYTPDYAASPFHYYYQTSLGPQLPIQYLSPYDYASEIGMGPPGMGNAGNFSSLIDFGLDNNLQIKVRSSRDSSGSRNIRLIDNFRLRSAYNLSADSFHWTPMTMSFATELFEVLKLIANASFDPYRFDYETGRRMDQILGWDNGLARFIQGSLSLAGGFRSQPREAEGGELDKGRRQLTWASYDDFVDFNVPWNLNLTYTLNLSQQYQPQTRRDSLHLDHYLGGNGSFNLTPRWKLEVYSGYNLTTKQMAITQLSIYRDMHCWEMRLSAVPFGLNRNFNFTLNVKARVLQDLKLIRRRDYRDALR